MNKKELIDQIYKYATDKVTKVFEPGIDDVPVSGAMITAEDITAVVSCVLDGWFTEGKISAEFCKQLAHWTGTRHVSLCNSGSSANLLALTALAHRQPGNRTKANLVITCATGFPTTVSAIYHAGLTPLFVDSAGYHKLNANDDTVLEALGRKDVIGVILAHTLGFPFRADLIRRRCDELGKFFVEDCCDSLSATIDGNYVGQFGHASTLSFFPAHHITSLDYSELVFVKDFYGYIHLIQIGEFVEHYKPNMGWECVAFDENGNLSFSEISDVIKHPVYEPLYKVKLQTGREVIVSESHNLFTRDEAGNILSKKTSDFQILSY